MRPLIIAHRGASSDAPENTAAAFRAAIEQGADMVELDVRWSAEGMPVVMHDPGVERTTDGKGQVAALRLEEIRRLDAGSWFSSGFRGEPVLTLSEALAILGPRIRMNIELCADVQAPERFATRLMRLVEDARLPEAPLFSSFDFSLLATLRAEHAEARIAPLFRAATAPVLRRVLTLGAEAAHPRRHLVTPGLLRRLHGAGLRVHAWTVNDPPEARRLLRLGVDGIFTDHPLRMVRLRALEAARPAERARAEALSRAHSAARRPAAGRDTAGARGPGGRGRRRVT